MELAHYLFINANGQKSFIAKKKTLRTSKTQMHGLMDISKLLKRRTFTYHWASKHIN